MRKVALLLLTAVAVACGGRDRGKGESAAPSQQTTLDQGQKVLGDPSATRDALVREAEHLGSLAVAENGTARGVLLATLAGELRAVSYTHLS